MSAELRLSGAQDAGAPLQRVAGEEDFFDLVHI